MSAGGTSSTLCECSNTKGNHKSRYLLKDSGDGLDKVIPWECKTLRNEICLVALRRRSTEKENGHLLVWSLPLDCEQVGSTMGAVCQRISRLGKQQLWLLLSIVRVMEDRKVVKNKTSDTKDNVHYLLYEYQYQVLVRYEICFQLLYSYCSSRELSKGSWFCLDRIRMDPCKHDRKSIRSCPNKMKVDLPSMFYQRFNINPWRVDLFHMGSGGPLIHSRP